MSDETRLKKAVHIMFFTALLIVCIGYYSYLAHDIDVLRPDIPLMNTGQTGHNRFARSLIILLPFVFILHVLWNKKPLLKILLTFSFIISALAIVLSTSRIAYLASLVIIVIWAFFFSKTKGYNFKKIMSVVMIITILFGVFSYIFFPDVKKRVARLPQDLSTLNERTDSWIPALQAFSQKPVFGWGYGHRIFHMDTPYKDTPSKRAPTKGPHNTFLRILFLQGIIGLIPYVLLLIMAIKTFWREAFKTTGIQSYILMACFSVLIGNYIINAMLADLRLIYLSVVLGLGMAAKGIDENSHN
jgi:O-antigen ligase